MNKRLLTNILLIVMALAVVIGVQVLRGGDQVQAAPAPKQVICHAAGPPPTQYIRIEVSSNAGTDNGNGGHFNEDATTKPGHAFDILLEDGGECPGDPEPSPSPSPSPK